MTILLWFLVVVAAWATYRFVVAVRIIWRLRRAFAKFAEEDRIYQAWLERNEEFIRVLRLQDSAHPGRRRGVLPSQRETQRYIREQKERLIQELHEDLRR